MLIRRAESKSSMERLLLHLDSKEVLLLLWILEQQPEVMLAS